MFRLDLFVYCPIDAIRTSFTFDFNRLRMLEYRVVLFEYSFERIIDEIEVCLVYIRLLELVL